MYSKYSKHDLRQIQFTDGHRVVSHREVNNILFWVFEQIKDADLNVNLMSYYF